MTMYTDYCLKFKDAAEADAVLFTEQTNVQDDIVEVFKTPRYAAVDVIGVIYKPTGKMLQTDEGEVPEMAPVDGWHVNVRHTADAPELDAYKVAPKAPVRGWA
jgi:hypothetical protein